jgi:hypothetical protein
VRMYRRRMARRGSGNPNPSRVSPRLPACTAGADFYGPARSLVARASQAAKKRVSFSFPGSQARLGLLHASGQAQHRMQATKPTKVAYHGPGWAICN